jgi:hypothetical protein
LAIDNLRLQISEHGTCFLAGMQATLPLQQPEIKAQPTTPDYCGVPDLKPSVPEIRSYLAVRNLLLREAEENTTEANLRRAGSANDFAESCLARGKSPYEAQALSESEAARERRHCRSVRVRLAELRARLRRRAA